MTIFYNAIYSDGTHFTFSEDSQNSKDYAKIDRTKLIAFEIYNDTKLLHKLHLEPNQRLIVRRRYLIQWGRRVNPDWKEGDDPEKRMIGFHNEFPVYLVGYQETIKGENRQSILIIHPDGHTEAISKWKNAPLDAVNLTEDEKKEIQCNL